MTMNSIYNVARVSFWRLIMLRRKYIWIYYIDIYSKNLPYKIYITGQDSYTSHQLARVLLPVPTAWPRERHARLCRGLIQISTVTYSPKYSAIYALFVSLDHSTHVLNFRKYRISCHLIIRPSEMKINYIKKT